MKLSRKRIEMIKQNENGAFDETTGKTFQATAFPGFINKIIEHGGLLPYLKARQEA